MIVINRSLRHCRLQGLRLAAAARDAGEMVFSSAAFRTSVPGGQARRTKTSTSRRAAITIISLYALLLQAFAAAIAPTPDTATPGDVTCLQKQPKPQQPDAPHHQRAICCVLVCAGFASADLCPASGADVFYSRRVSVLAWIATAPSLANAQGEAHFFARGPPGASASAAAAFI